MNETAVKWLVDQLFRNGYFDGNKPLSFTNLDHLQHQAEEMFQKQIEEAWYNGASSDPLPTHKNANHYYEKTYGGKK